jgi:hypothetical protein
MVALGILLIKWEVVLGVGHVSIRELWCRKSPWYRRSPLYPRAPRKKAVALKSVSPKKKPEHRPHQPFLVLTLSVCHPMYSTRSLQYSTVTMVMMIILVMIMQKQKGWRLNIKPKTLNLTIPTYLASRFYTSALSAYHTCWKYSFRGCIQSIFGDRRRY